MSESISADISSNSVSSLRLLEKETRKVNALISNPDNCVKDYLSGIKEVYPGLSVDTESQIIMSNKIQKKVVALLSGGGSGHEPFGSGYVGKNMLSSFVAGSVFTSPPVHAITKAIATLAEMTHNGILVIILNYTGDILNFGIAIERAHQANIKVESIIFGEDTANLFDTYHKTGRRGLCGIALFIKILSSMATAGVSLSKLKEKGEEMLTSMFTIGVALSSCTLPGQKKPLWNLESNKIEIGVGIHGEKGIEKKKICAPQAIVTTLLDHMFKLIEKSSDDKFVILVNNLGICSDLEMYTVAHLVIEKLGTWNTQIDRLYVGKFMTSLDMKGIQITIFNIKHNKDWLKHLDTETDAYVWNVSTLPCKVPNPTTLKFVELDNNKSPAKVKGLILDEKQAAQFKLSLVWIANALEKSEEALNTLDSGCGDGDTGTCFKKLSIGILNDINKWPLNDVSQTFFMMSLIAESQMGGTSGALYSLLFVGASMNASSWEKAWGGALTTLNKYSNADVGDRTLIDALKPAYDTFKQLMTTGPDDWKTALGAALKSAKDGCNKTSSMKPRLGRASYVDESLIKDVDAGAFCVVVWLTALCNCLLYKIDDPIKD